MTRFYVSCISVLSSPTLPSIKGIETVAGQKHELDVLIFASGFNAITGAWADIEWHGKDDRPLLGYSDSPSGRSAIWIDRRPRTFLRA